jgi:hypothetical protein
MPRIKRFILPTLIEPVSPHPLKLTFGQRLPPTSRSFVRKPVHALEERSKSVEERRHIWMGRAVADLVDRQRTECGLAIAPVMSPIK